MHDVRIAYYVRDEEPISESEFLPFAGRCPITGARTPAPPVKYPPVWFGRMFKAREGFPPKKEDANELMAVAQCLINLGDCMNDPAAYFELPEHQQDAPAVAVANALQQEESDIPAGYTYLGQFITHEITFDGTGATSLPLYQPNSVNIRSPSLDLDSLYGAGPEKSKELYGDGPFPALLRVGWTQPPPPILTDSSQRSFFPAEFQNDLPRKAQSDEKQRGVAIIGDERNDENLPLAQTHVAFLRFHNRVVEDLDAGRYKDFARPAPEDLFDKAKAEVVRHFQWIILKDYLPRLVDKDLVESLTRNPSDRFNPKSETELFIPLEFSAAAFRIGHSMVRQKYKWNREHLGLKQKGVVLSQLFANTKRSGNLGGLDRLDSTWVIDWKRFYDFTPFKCDYPPPYDPVEDFNRAGKIDTTFDLHIEQITGFQHLPTHEENNGAGEKLNEQKPEHLLFDKQLFNKQKALPVRNLLRGLALGLPWAEDVMKAMEIKEGQRLTPEKLRGGPHEKLLAKLGEKTPLWFYVLKEAKEQGNGGKLGPVGGGIVAETLIGLIRHSKYSILRLVEGKESEWALSDWRPAYGRLRDVPEGVQFEMVDLLRAADIVDPVGKYLIEHP